MRVEAKWKTKIELFMLYPNNYFKKTSCTHSLCLLVSWGPLPKVINKSSMASITFCKFVYITPIYWRPSYMCLKLFNDYHQVQYLYICYNVPLILPEFTSLIFKLPNASCVLMVARLTDSIANNSHDILATQRLQPTS